MEPAFFANPTPRRLALPDAPGGRPDRATRAWTMPSASSRATRPSAFIAASDPTTSCSPWAAARPAGTPPSSPRGAAAAPSPSSPRRCPHDRASSIRPWPPLPRRGSDGSRRAPGRSLGGATIGLLANGKSNGMALLDRIAEHLRERHGIGEVVRVAKTNASAPVTEEDAEVLAKRCAVVITAIGD